ncbi:MAG: hypothetical protein ACW99F_15980 [Candidatus Hodarchaeales archaeon]|jgi:hypothetical protein
MTEVKIPVELIIGKSVQTTVLANTKEPESQLDAMALIGTNVIASLKKNGYRISKMRKPKAVLPKNEEALKEIQKLGQELDNDEKETEK